MAKIGTLVTGDGVVTDFQLNYVPQKMSIVAATAPKGVKLTVEGDGVPTLLDENGCLAFDSIRKIDERTNEYVYVFADGLIKGKNTTLSITNSAAQTPDVYVSSENKGRRYFQQQGQAALAATGVEIDKFAFAAFPSAAAADTFTIEFADGTTQQMNRLDLADRLGYTQKLKQSASDYAIDNFKQTVKSILFVPVAAQTLYLAKWIPAMGKVKPMLD